MRVTVTELRPEHINQGYSTLLAELANVEVERSDAESICLVRQIQEITDLVALGSDGEVVGCVSLWCEQRFHKAEKLGRVTDLIVREDCRRQGVGTKLVKAAIEEAKRHGCASVVLQSTERALPFYASLGFQQQPKSYDLCINV